MKKTAQISSKKVKKETKSNRIVLYILVGVFALVFANMCRIVFEYFYYTVDSDMIVEARFIRTVVEDGNILTKNWSGGNESLLSRPFFLSIPLFILTGDMVLSQKITIIIAAVLIIACFALLLKKIGFKKELSIFLCTLLISFFNLATDTAFYSYYSYSMHIIVTLLVIYMYLELYIEKSFSGNKGKSIFLAGAAFYTGIWGERMLIILWGPLILLAGYDTLKKILKDNEINIKEEKMLIETLLFALINICGIIFSKYILKVTYTHKAISVLKVDEIIKNLGVGVLSLTDELSIPTGISLNTIAGVEFILKCGFYICTIIIAITIVKNIKDSKRDFVLKYFSVSVFIMFLYIVIVLGAQANRFLIMARYGIVILTGYTLLYLEQKTLTMSKYRIGINVILGLVILVTLICNLKMYKPYFESNRNFEREKVAHYLEEENYTHIFATYWESGVQEALTNGVVESGTIDIKNNALVPVDWYVDKKIYEEVDKGWAKVCFVLTDDEEERLEDDGTMKKNMERVREKEIGIYNIYNFKDLKIDFSVGLPNEGINEDYPYSPRIMTANGTIDSEGRLVTDGVEGVVMYGPYSETLEGTYKFTIHYEILEGKGEVGKFDVVTNSGQKLYGEVPLKENETQVVIDDIVFEDNKELLEYRVYIKEGCKVKINKIEIEKKGK